MQHRRGYKNRGIRAIVLCGLAVGLASCGGQLETFFDPYRYADTVAARASLEAELVSTPDFTIRTFHRPLIPGEDLIIYLEGDGRAFNRYGGITNDPTPRYPIALELAAVDRRPNVIYIARPCQYVIRYALDLNCQYRYWVDERFPPSSLKQSTASSINSRYEHRHSKSS